jgi:hypothetical protein
MASRDDKDIASVRARLSELDAERSMLTERLKDLQSQTGAGSLSNSGIASVSGESRAALAYLETSRVNSIPAALERSRSGEGGHVWIFFSQPIPARDARQLGTVLLTETLERRPELGFKSYDRLFPSQDAVPKGGFGNLIALPLQRRARDTATASSWIIIFMPIATNGRFLPPLAV